VWRDRSGWVITSPTGSLRQPLAPLTPTQIPGLYDPETFVPGATNQMTPVLRPLQGRTPPGTAVTYQ
jgi:hypothetical protein